MRTSDRTVAPASSRQVQIRSRQDAGATESFSIRSRGRLPHWERAEGTYFVTFRLVDTLSSEVLESWKSERQDTEAAALRQGPEFSVQERRRLHDLYTERVDSYLDSGAGPCWLRKPEIARVVVEALQFFDGQRYGLHAWSIMPNHVHVVFTVGSVVAPTSSRQAQAQGRRDAGATTGIDSLLSG